MLNPRAVSMGTDGRVQAFHGANYPPQQPPFYGGSSAIAPARSPVPSSPLPAPRPLGGDDAAAVLSLKSLLMTPVFASSSSSSGDKPAGASPAVTKAAAVGSPAGVSTDAPSVESKKAEDRSIPAAASAQDKSGAAVLALKSMLLKGANVAPASSSIPPAAQQNSAQSSQSQDKEASIKALKSLLIRESGASAQSPKAPVPNAASASRADPSQPQDDDRVAALQALKSLLRNGPGNASAAPLVSAPQSPPPVGSGSGSAPSSDKKTPGKSKAAAKSPAGAQAVSPPAAVSSNVSSTSKKKKGGTVPPSAPAPAAPVTQKSAQGTSAPAAGPNGKIKFASSSFLNSPDPNHMPVPEFDFDAEFNADSSSSPVLADRPFSAPPTAAGVGGAVGSPGGAVDGISSLRRLLKISS